MQRLSVTVTPWMYGSADIELRVRWESGGDVGEERQVIRLSEFDSLFDMCLARAGESIKRLHQQQQQKEAQREG